MVIELLEAGGLALWDYVALHVLTCLIPAASLMKMGMVEGPALTPLLTGPGLSLPNWLASPSKA